MDEFHRYGSRPFAFIFRYIRSRPASHAIILIAVLAAVACSAGTQYAVKLLVDILSDSSRGGEIWLAFAFLVTLIAADNLLWRLASWVASFTFVRVTGDLRRDLFRHLTGHSLGYFADRLPGTLTSRVTATSNATYTVENMVVWNVLPPCVATLAAITLVATVSMSMAIGLAVIAGIVVVGMFHLAAAGRTLHYAFADKAAIIDGEMVDVISNMPLVNAFCGAYREHCRFDAVVDQEMTARRRSLLYLEKLRLLHALTTVILTTGLAAWAIVLWQRGAVTTGDVVLTCTLGLSVLHATRDLAVALVDVTQHVARLSEALATLLLPHEMRDHPNVTTLVKHGASVAFKNVTFQYPDGRSVFAEFNLKIERSERIGLVGPSGSGKSTLFALLQRFYDLHGGRILIDDQDISKVTRDSLRAAIAVVPQDIALFQRSIMENIRYGQPSAPNEVIYEAAAAARCDFIQSLPNGIDTIVGDRGVKLSGGQRQRLAIARAFLKDAPLLLLDEATSALDAESEEAIREALDLLMRGRTVIAIAHRISTVRGFDRIVVLREGQIIEDGSPNHLMRQNGVYRQIVRREMVKLTRSAA